MALPAIPPIELTAEQLADIAEAVELLEKLADDLEKAKHCSVPGLEECEAQRRELLRRLRSFQEQFGPRQPTTIPRRKRR